VVQRGAGDLKSPAFLMPSWPPPPQVVVPSSRAEATQLLHFTGVRFRATREERPHVLGGDVEDTPQSFLGIEADVCSVITTSSRCYRMWLRTKSLSFFSAPGCCKSSSSCSISSSSSKTSRPAPTTMSVSRAQSRASVSARDPRGGFDQQRAELHLGKRLAVYMVR
jgi:hypothetical protein